MYVYSTLKTNQEEVYLTYNVRIYRNMFYSNSYFLSPIMFVVSSFYL